MAIGLVLGACSLTTSLDGLTGGASSDAGNAGDAGAADAPALDASTRDSSADGASEGGRYCATVSPTPGFCDDFDDEGPFSRWTTSVIGAGGSVVRDRAAARSNPNSLLTTSAASTVSIPAYLRRTSPSSVHRVRVAYDMRVEARDPQTAYAEVGYIRFGAGTRIHAFYIRLFASTSEFSSEAYLSDGGIPVKNVGLGNPLSSWTRVAVDYDLRAAPHVSVTLDGVLAGDTPLDPSLFTPAVADVDIGVGYSGHPSSAGWQLRYDDVTVDFEP
jgi:hypothetical protein